MSGKSTTASRRRRKEFTDKTKRLADERSQGRCEGHLVGTPCDVIFTANAKCEYDHIIEDFYEGGNHVDNCARLCIDCHRAKTKRIRPTMEKSRRLIRQRQGLPKRKRRSAKIPSRPFPKGSRKLPSRKMRKE